MKREWRIVSVVLGFATALVCSIASAQDAQAFKGQTLRVAGYGGGTGKIFREAVTGPFEQRTGARLEWSEGAPLEFAAQLLAGKGSPPSYDVAFIEDVEEISTLQQGVIFKPDLSKIPNSKLLPAKVLAEHSTVLWGYFRLGIAYLPDKLKAAGIPPPKDMSIIFDPRVAGHVALPDVTQSNWPNFMPTIAAFLGNSLDNPKATLDKLASIKNFSLFSSSSDMEARMTSGEIWVSLWIDGRVNGLKLKGVPIEFAPMGIADGKGGKYDYTAVLGLLAITNPAKKQLAEIYIDTVISTPVATQIALRSTYAPSNIEAQKALKADPKLGPLVETDLSKQFVPDFAAWQKVQDKWIDAWGKVMRR